MCKSNACLAQLRRPRRVIMTYFEGFEHRAGVDRQQQSKLKAKEPWPRWSLESFTPKEPRLRGVGSQLGPSRIGFGAIKIYYGPFPYRGLAPLAPLGYRIGGVGEGEGVWGRLGFMKAQQGAAAIIRS